MFVEITCENKVKDPLHQVIVALRECGQINKVTAELIDSEDVILCGDCRQVILVCTDKLKMELRELY